MYLREITGMLTPRGLKIRLDGYFCELLPYIKNKNVNDILIETESFACLNRWLIFVVGIIAFFAGLSNNTLFILAFVITIIISLSYWIHPLFLFVRGTVFFTQPRNFVTIKSLFIDKIILIIIGFFTVDWQGLLFYVLGNTIGIFLEFVLDFFLVKSKYSQFGVALMSDENVFIYLSLQYLDRTTYIDWIKSYSDYLNLGE